LELGLPGVGALSEYLEDEREPVDHLDALGKLAADVERLVRPNVVVDDHGVGVGPADQIAELRDLPFSEHERGVLGASLGEFADHVVARGGRELGDLRQVRGSGLDALGDDRAPLGGGRLGVGVPPSTLPVITGDRERRTRRGVLPALFRVPLCSRRI